MKPMATDTDAIKKEKDGHRCDPIRTDLNFAFCKLCQRNMNSLSELREMMGKYYYPKKDVLNIIEKLKNDFVDPDDYHLLDIIIKELGDIND